MNKSIFDKLSSIKRSDVIDALYEIPGWDSNDYNNSIREILLQLFQHTDADIRALAIRTACIERPVTNACDALKAMTERGEHDQLVLHEMLDGIKHLHSTGSVISDDFSMFLIDAALNFNLDVTLSRKAKTLLILLGVGKSTPDSIGTNDSWLCGIIRELVNYEDVAT